MKCPRCHRDGLASTVSTKGDAKPWSREMAFQDQHKRLHIHDPNDCTISYTCSQGHQWSRKVSHPCWCGWSKYVSENIASVRVFSEIWCWVGEDNFILMNGKSYKGLMDVRLETGMMPEIEEILLENEAGLCSLMRGIEAQLHLSGEKEIRSVKF
jgi:hypothetical protein